MSPLSPDAFDEGSRKRLVTVQAEAALAGVQLVVTTDDAGRCQLVASWRGLTTQLHSVEAAERWLARFNGASASQG